jgi:acetolactate synthase small subunit
MRRVFSLLVDNRFGELPRVVGLCSGRGFRIEGVTAVESDGGETMRIDVVTDCDEAAAERLRKLLASQVRVLEAVTLAADRSAEREVALIEVEAEGDTVRLRLGLARRSAAPRPSRRSPTTSQRSAPARSSAAAPSPSGGPPSAAPIESPSVSASLRLCSLCG